MRYGTGIALTLRCWCGSTHAKCQCNTWAATHWPKERCWFAIWSQIWKNGATQATQEKHKKHTSTGRKFALVECLSHDLVCAGSIYHVHFAWQVWHRQHTSGLKKKLKSLSRGEIDKSHVDKRILGGKGLQYEDSTSITFCPVSALRDRCCIDTKVFMWIHSAECECNTWAGTHWPKERRWFGICGQIWRAMGQPRQPKKNTKVTLRQEESLRLLKVWVMT